MNLNEAIIPYGMSGH